MSLFADTVDPTPFGVFDNDVSFKTDADNIVKFVKRKLGDDILSVELTKKQIWSCFEESALEYSAIINQYQAKSVLANMLCESTGSGYSISGDRELKENRKENKYPKMSFETLRRYSLGVGSEIGVGGNVSMYSGSISLIANIQDYDLQTLLSSSAAANYGTKWKGDKLRIKDVYHFSPVPAFRFFNTNSGLNYLNSEFSFASYTPETIFHVLPVWEDVLRGGQMGLSMKVRRSNYSYEIINNHLRIFPTPTINKTLWIRYAAAESVYDDDDPRTYGVTNLSNVPFENIKYSSLNSIAQTWIKGYTLALSKEILGLVRSKYSSIPIPNSELTMNGAELIAQGREDQVNLKTKLYEELDLMTYDKLAENDANMAENVNRQLKQFPMGIFVG